MKDSINFEFNEKLIIEEALMMLRQKLADNYANSINNPCSMCCPSTVLEKINNTKYLIDNLDNIEINIKGE